MFSQNCIKIILCFVKKYLHNTNLAAVEKCWPVTNNGRFHNKITILSTVDTTFNFLLLGGIYRKLIVTTLLCLTLGTPHHVSLATDDNWLMASVPPRHGTLHATHCAAWVSSLGPRNYHRALGRDGSQWNYRFYLWINGWFNFAICLAITITTLITRLSLDNLEIKPVILHSWWDELCLQCLIIRYNVVTKVQYDRGTLHTITIHCFDGHCYQIPRLWQSGLWCHITRSKYQLLHLLSVTILAKQKTCHGAHDQFQSEIQSQYSLFQVKQLIFCVFCWCWLFLKTPENKHNIPCPITSDLII